MYGITDIYAFSIATFFIVLAPGPNSIFVFSLALQSTKKAAILGAIGIFFGDASLMFLSAIGATTVLNLFPSFLIIIKIIGAIYIIWIGINLIISGINRWKKNKEVIVKTKKKIIDSSLIKAYTISLLNPKAIFFFLSFFLQFIDPDYPNKFVPFLIEASIVQLFSVIYLTCLIVIGQKVYNYTSGKNKQQGIFQSVVGGVIFGFGVALLTSSR